MNTEWNSDGGKTKLVKSIIPLHDYIQGLALIEKGGRLVSKRYKVRVKFCQQSYYFQNQNMYLGHIPYSRSSRYMI